MSAGILRDLLCHVVLSPARLATDDPICSFKNSNLGFEHAPHNGQLNFLLDDLGLLRPATEFSCVVTDAESPRETPQTTEWGTLQTLAAEPVPGPNDPAANALDRFVAPFSVNTPIDAGTESWTSTPPDGEGSNP